MNRRKLLSSSIALAVALAAAAHAIEPPPAPAQAFMFSRWRPSWPEQRLSLSLLEPSDRTAERGAPLRLSISATQRAWFALVLADAQGGVRVILPSSDSDVAQLNPGDARIFPDAMSDEQLPADLAPGTGRIYVIASSKPVFDPHENWSGSGPVSEKVSAAMDAATSPGAANHVAWDQLSLTIRDPAPRQILAANEVVDFFANRVRGPGASLGLLVQFDFNSDQLQDFGRRQLDQLGMGLNNPQLAGDRYILEGHTDDIGSAAYNDDLSMRRARAVREYLVKKQQVDPGRLSATGLGSKQMIMDPDGDMEKSRANSRRVVIRRLDP